MILHNNPYSHIINHALVGAWNLQNRLTKQFQWDEFPLKVNSMELELLHAQHLDNILPDKFGGQYYSAAKRMAHVGTPAKRSFYSDHFIGQADIDDKLVWDSLHRLPIPYKTEFEIEQDACAYTLWFKIPTGFEFLGWITGKAARSCRRLHDGIWYVDQCWLNKSYDDMIDYILTINK
jgi:hypothetical protein